jgi:hypothetical protein
VACPPGIYTYVASYGANWVITDNAALYVYLINDSTSITAVAQALVSQTTPPQL